MSTTDIAHGWWSRLRHQGMLLSPVVMLERFPDAPQPAAFHLTSRLRDAHTRFLTDIEIAAGNQDQEERAILTWADAVMQQYVGHDGSRLAKQNAIPEKLTAVIRIGSRSETIRPQRVVFADGPSTIPAILVMADTSEHVGRGRGRNTYARFLELLRGTGHRLGLLTNGRQFRLIYAGLDFESWCEWESERWFDDGEGSEELAGFRQLLSPESLNPVRANTPGLLDAVEESRKRQADLSSVLRENVRQAVELLLEEVSAAHRTSITLFDPLLTTPDGRKLSDAEAHEALLQATVRVVMRMVVCLFAESRQLLPVNDPVYGQSYGVRSLYELLDEATRYEGGTHGLLNRRTAWPRLMALFRLIHGGSAHGNFPLQPYGGTLFRPGDKTSSDAVSRALHIIEYSVPVCDATILGVLRKLLRGPLPVIRGRTKAFVEGPVDYTDLRTEFIGLIYEGLLDYRLKRTDEETGPQVFLNLGREPVLPLGRLADMLKDDPKGLKDLLTTLRKEKVTASVSSDEEGEEEAEEDSEAEEQEQSEEAAEPAIEIEGTKQEEGLRQGSYLDAVQAAKQWAAEAVVLAGLVGKQKKKEPDSEYKARIEAEANKLINRVVAPGEFYLVRAGNTRKGTGTFYTRPQLAVPTVHRTLEPLCYEKADDGTLIPKKPDAILGLKICDPACGSASFLVGALHYVTEALYKALCYHCELDDPVQAKRITLPFGRPRTGKDGEQLVPFPPNDPQRGDVFPDRVKALLRRHVVERCIYGVDINPLAVELARVSLWVETLDPELPFSFLDHKIKVGNSLVGCWLDRVVDYPLKAWEREGGDGKDGPRTQRIETFLKGLKGPNGKRSGDGIVKREMRELIESRFSKQFPLFHNTNASAEDVVKAARAQYELLHQLPPYETEKRERQYRLDIERSPAIIALKRAMDEWCAVWFWPSDEESLKHVPRPLSFHRTMSERDRIVQGLHADLKFFHWEVEFPDVFTSDRSGFDSVIGNPPWETMQQESMEFFSDYDPIYRTYGRLEAEKHRQSLFKGDPQILVRWEEYCATHASMTHWCRSVAGAFDMSLARGNENALLHAAWNKARSNRVGFTSQEHPFTAQGTGKTYSFKLFLELAYTLLTPTGRMGFIVPSSLYTDNGTKGLRELFLDQATWNWLFSFENKKRIFSIHGSFKFAAVVVDRRRTGDTMNAAFMIHDLGDWERSSPPVFPFDRGLIPLFSPRSKSLPEVRTQRDLDICRKVYENSFRIGDNAPGWEITYAQEFNMTTDAKHFPPKEKWEAEGYRPDVFGRWTGPEGEVALPLYEGRMIGQFDFAKKGWVSGKGRTAVWRDIPDDHKTFEPQFLTSQGSFAALGPTSRSSKIAYMRISSATNSRSMLATLVAGLPCEVNASTLSLDEHSVTQCLLLATVLNSYSFDFCLRTRFGSITLNWFIVEECPLPNLLMSGSTKIKRLAMNAARMSMTHRWFAPEWLRFLQEGAEEPKLEWKHLWAVSPSDRVRLRVETDAICADAFGLTATDFDWIVRDDPSDPKGFWRVDKELPYRERLTGLAAAAFRALKDGKWSAESAAKLSNDDFFEVIGIPEMTSVKAAKALNLPEPLIYKRKGCHTWEPEKFQPTDPRYGWTWDDCWKDAVALLGSEQAVKEYIEGKAQADVHEEKSPPFESKKFKLRADDSRQGRLF